MGGSNLQALRHWLLAGPATPFARGNDVTLMQQPRNRLLTSICHAFGMICHAFGTAAAVGLRERAGH